MLRKASSFHSNRIFRRVANPLRGFNQMMLMEEQLRVGIALINFLVFL